MKARLAWLVAVVGGGALALSAAAQGQSNLAVGPDAGGYLCPDGRQLYVKSCYDNLPDANCGVVNMHLPLNGQWQVVTNDTRGSLTASVASCKIYPLEFRDGIVSLVLPSAPPQQTAKASAAAPAPAAKTAEKPDAQEVCEQSTDKLAAAEACELLGSVYEMDMGDGPQFELAGRFHHRACSLGLGSGCRSMGTLFSFGSLGATGNPPVPNHKLAVVYFRKACDLDPKECAWLGGSYEQGEGVGKDMAEAQRLYSRSCAAKDGLGCYYAAKIMETLGNGTPAQVLQLHTQGCDFEDNTACFEASRRHERGIGTKVDKAKAAALRSEACRLDYFESLEKGFCPKEPAKAPAKPRS